MIMTKLFHREEKYIFSPAINKGMAFEGLKAYISYENMIAVGDSVIDLLMLQNKQILKLYIKKAYDGKQYI